MITDDQKAEIKYIVQDIADCILNTIVSEEETVEEEVSE